MATAPGIQERDKLVQGGFSAEQVVAWEASTRDRFAKSGFSNEQIDSYFGAGKISNQAVMGLRDTQFPAVAGEDGVDDGSQQKEAEGFLQSLEAGFQGSITGLQKNQSLPELVLDDEANFAEVFGAALGQFGGDLPVSLPSFVGGAFAGGSIAGAAGGATTRNPLATAVGAGFGAAVGGEATSGFVTEATRQALINFYRDNRNAGVEVDAKDFSNQLIAAVFDLSVLKQGAKGGAVGAVTGLTGGTGRIFLKPVIGNPALRQAVVSSAEVTTAVTASAALEGQLPRAQDFAAGAALVLGLDVAIRVGGAASKPIKDAGKALEDHYARTGERPQAAAERARKDPVFRQEILGGQKNAEGVNNKVAVAVKETVDKNGDVTAVTAGKDTKETFKFSPLQEEVIGKSQNLSSPLEVVNKATKDLDLVTGEIEALRSKVVQAEAEIAKRLGLKRFPRDISKVEDSLTPSEADFLFQKAVDLDELTKLEGLIEPIFNEQDLVQELNTSVRELPRNVDITSLSKSEELAVARLVFLNNQAIDLGLDFFGTLKKSVKKFVDTLPDPDDAEFLGSNIVKTLEQLADEPKINRKALLLEASKAVDDSEAPPNSIIIEDTPETPNAAKGAKASTKKMGDTIHSKVVGAGRPKVFDTTPVKKADTTDIVATARAKIREKIQPIEKRRGSPREVVDNLRFSFANDLQYVVSQSEVAAKTATGKRLAIEDNPGETMRLAFGAHARADLQIKFGIFDAEGKKVSRSYDEILEGVKDVDAFVEYMTSRRVLEKELQGFETGFDPTAADVIVKDADANTDFRARSAEIQKWNNATLFEAAEKGLFTRKEVDNMIAQNKDFVPFARVMDVGKPPPGVSVRGFPVRKPTKKFKGSDKDILDTLEIMLKNKYMTLQVIENNSGRQRLVDFNEGLPDNAKMFTLAKKQLTKTEIAEGDTQVKKFLEDNGLDISDATGLHIYRAASKALGKGDFVVFREGEPVTYTAKDPTLVLSLQQQDRTTQNALIKMMQVPSALLRGGVTLNPEFSLSASFRDQLGAVLINDFTVVPFLDLFRGLFRLNPDIQSGASFKDFIKETGRTNKAAASRNIDKVVVQWINEGGANSALLALDQRSLSEAMSLTNSKSIRESAWNTVIFPVRKAAVFATMMENAMRVSRFERALKEGKSKQTAALESRDINLDFGRVGADVRSYNLITTWVGAAINGIDRFNTAFTRDPAGTLMKTAAHITIPSMVLWALHKDELWFQELPEWERMLFWHFPIGGTNDDPDFVVRVPMPHQFGTIFGYLPTKLFEEFEKANPEPGKAVRESIAQAYSIPLVPTAVTPLAEIAMNESFFTGNPLVSRAQERILPEFQYTPHTTQLSRKLAQLLATVPGGIIGERFTSPAAIEHMVRGYGGTLGTLALQALDTGFKNAGFLEDIDKPDPTMADNPVYGAFFSRNESARQSITDFYENAEDMEQIVNTIRQEAARGNPEQIERILRRRGFPKLKPGKVKEALGKLRKMSYAIHFDKTMKGDEKRQLINEINKQQVAIARAFNEQTETFKRLEKERRKAERKK